MRDMTDDAIGADDGGMLGCRMNHRAVLDARPRTDRDASRVAAKYRGRPDARLRADVDASDHDRVRVHERRIVDLGDIWAKGVDGHAGLLPGSRSRWSCR